MKKVSFKSYATILAFLFSYLNFNYALAAPTVTATGSSPVYAYANFTSTGADTWTIPYGVSTVSVDVVGGGGGGGTDGGSAGGGGDLQEYLNLAVTAGSSVSVNVGGGGGGGVWGGNAAADGTGTTATIGGVSFSAPGGKAGGGWTTTTGGAGGAAGSGGTAYAGKQGGGGAGSCNSSTVSVGTAGVTGTTSSVNSVVYGSSGGGGASSDNNGLSATLGKSGGTNGGHGANYKLALDGVTSISGASHGGDGVANTGAGGGAGSACNTYGAMASGIDGVYQRTPGGNGAAGVVVIKFTYTAPSTPVLDSASDSGYSNSDRITNINTPTFTGTAIGGSTIQLQVDGVNTGNTCTADSTLGTWSCTAGTLSDGSHNITAISTLGAATATSSSLSVTIDTAVPTLSSASTNSAGTQITLTYNSTLNSATIPNESFTVTVLGVIDTETSAIASSTNVVITLTVPIPTGASPTVSYTNPAGYQANTIQDLAGNEAASLASQAVTNSSTITETSTVAISISGSIAKLTTVTITATVSSPLTPAGTVTFLDNGKAITRCSARTLSNSAATCSWKILIQGQRALTANFAPTYPASVNSSSTVKYVTVGKRIGTR